MLPTDFQAAKPKRSAPSLHEVGAISARRPARWNGTACCGDNERAPQFPSSQSSESPAQNTTPSVIRQATDVRCDRLELSAIQNTAQINFDSIGWSILSSATEHAVGLCPSLRLIPAPCSVFPVKTCQKLFNLVTDRLAGHLFVSNEYAVILQSVHRFLRVLACFCVINTRLTGSVTDSLDIKCGEHLVYWVTS